MKKYINNLLCMFVCFVSCITCVFLCGCTDKGNVIPVENITLNKSSIEIDVGESQTLLATITPSNSTNNKIVWSSNDESIATIDSTGNVLGIADGSTQVYATIDGYSASCEVKVNEVIRYNDIIFKKWDSGNTIPISGNYFLNRDINLYTFLWIASGETINLYLNNHTINGLQYNITISNNTILNIYGNGEITSASIETLDIQSGATVNLYGGNVNTTSTSNECCAISICNDAVLNICGGSIRVNNVNTSSYAIIIHKDEHGQGRVNLIKGIINSANHVLGCDLYEDEIRVSLTASRDINIDLANSVMATKNYGGHNLVDYEASDCADYKYIIAE